MNDAIIAAYEKIVVQHKASTEDILECPALRSMFLSETRGTVGDLPERELLHRLSSLRKKGVLPKSRDLVGK